MVYSFVLSNFSLDLAGVTFDLSNEVAHLLEPGVHSLRFCSYDIFLRF